MFQKFVSTQLSFKLFLLWAIVVSFVLPYASTSAGITEDEVNSRAMGERVYAWYFEKDTSAAMSPVDSNGKWFDVTFDEHGRQIGLNVYGSFFNLLAEIMHRTVLSGVSDFYEARHMISAFFGALLFIFTGLIVQQLTGSWSAALFTLIVATFTPRLFGDAMTNVKDLPLATFFAFSLLQMVRFIKYLPHISVIRAILIALSLSFSIAIWVGSLLLIFYFFLGVAVYFLLQYLFYDFVLKQFLKTVWWTLGIAICGYLAASLFWPWAMQNPVLNPIIALKVFSTAYASLNNPQLFEGQWTVPADFRWVYVPKWFYITLPVITAAGLIVFLILAPVFLRKGHWRVACYSLLGASIVVPVARVIMSHLNPYDACRQLTFIIPSILVVASLAWVELFNQIAKTSIKVSLTIAIAIMILEPALFILCNHPVQSMYFSPLIGGTKGAFKNYEMDYYGVAVRPAFEWIVQNDTTANMEHKARVRLWYGEQAKLSHYANKSAPVQYVLADENSTGWDYSIEMAAEAKYNHDLLYRWPPKGTVYEVKADGAPLCAVIKNFRNSSSLNSATVPFSSTSMNDSSTHYINLGMTFYNAKEFDKSVLAFKKAIQFNNRSISAYNNLVSAYYAVNMYEEALEAGGRGLLIDSQIPILRNNISEALTRKRKQVYDEHYYFALSYHYHLQHEFQKCIDAAKKTLALNPKRADAWNNICSAYNELKEYTKAIEACDKGLQIEPQNEVMVNNRKYAEWFLKKSSL